MTGVPSECVTCTVKLANTLAESPTRFKPLLYQSEESLREDRSPPEASAWCEGYMTGVLLREEKEGVTAEQITAALDQRRLARHGSVGGKSTWYVVPHCTQTRRPAMRCRTISVGTSRLTTTSSGSPTRSATS